MRAGWFQKLFFCLAGIAAWPLATAASLPEGALLQVRPFVFPQAAYQGAEEEAARFSSAFYRQLLAALEAAGIRVEAVSLPEEEFSREAALPDGETVTEVEEDVGEVPEAAGNEEIEKDALMQMVKEAEKAEKAQAGGGIAAGKNAAQQADRPKGYVLAGKVLQYEEKVGVPVSTGKTRRTRAEVIFSGRYRITGLEGAVQADEPFSFSVSRVVPETADIHMVLQELGGRAFFNAAHAIAGQVSGKKQALSAGDDAEPGSEDDEYADSPGKRLRPASGRMKWLLH
ncbi:MAG: hypothetical protein NC211_07595 [Alistipes senegalensis]|nr:hypothetical protein [Oxalobacter formigenes]MCM1281672.1 hypothetical protein [Alistipes senegalensis]